MTVKLAGAVRTVVPSCPPEWAARLEYEMEFRNIDTKDRAAMFIAQCAHESAGFTRFVENLNYSAQALMRTWPSRFPSFDFATQYERNPEKIANFVYANRLGNGNEASGDGWMYRGRGVLQITGKDNYRKAGEGIRYPLEKYPQDLLVPEFGAAAAAWYWAVNGLNELADQDDFLGITRRINGGLIGLDSRKKWLDTALDKLEG